jgi:septal ring factor EnvC (AmiA/AmiB activator)
VTSTVSGWLLRVCAPLLAFALLCGTSAVGAAQQGSSREIAESQERLESIRAERRQLREEMTQIRARVHDLSGELANLEEQIAASADVLAELGFQLEQTQQQIGENTRDLLTARDHLAERKTILHRRLRDIYKRGPLHTVQVLLSAESFGDLLSRYKYLFLIARSDRVLLEDVARLESQLHSREEALRQGLMRLEELRQEKEVEHLALAGLEQQQQRTLSSVRSQERATAERIEQLARDEKRITALIAALERKRKEAERLAAERRRAAEESGRARKVGAESGASTLSTRDLGSLGWPVEGPLVYPFGRATQPNGTIIRWNGVGIGAAVGTSVRSVAEGSVVMAGPFEGYGPTVVLSHGGGYYSLYLYLKDIVVTEGDFVKQGQVLGTVGGEQTPEGPHVEFQIRAPGGRAVDPLAWLRKRR